MEKSTNDQGTLSLVPRLHSYGRCYAGAQQTVHLTKSPYLELLGLGFLEHAQGSMVDNLKLDLAALV